jgi:hypothetical protein
MTMGKTVRTTEIDDAIVNGLCEGTPLAQLARELGVGLSTIYDWKDADETFAGRIARAREVGFDVIAADVLPIVDDKVEDPASRRVRAEYRLKLLAKWDPKRYGDKTLVGSDPENPLPDGFRVTLVKAKDA